MQLRSRTRKDAPRRAASCMPCPCMYQQYVVYERYVCPPTDGRRKDGSGAGSFAHTHRTKGGWCRDTWANGGAPRRGARSDRRPASCGCISPARQQRRASKGQFRSFLAICFLFIFFSKKKNSLPSHLLRRISRF